MVTHLLLFAVIALSVYSQLMMKSRATSHSSPSDSPQDFVTYLVDMALDWRVLTAVAATFAAGVFWLLVIRRLELSYAFPFMAVSFVLVPVASGLVLKESLGVAQVAGLLLVFAGVTLSALSR